MDALSIYWNAVWQHTRARRGKIEPLHTEADHRAFARSLRLPSHLTFSALAGKWRIGDSEARGRHDDTVRP